MRPVHWHPSRWSRLVVIAISFAVALPAIAPVIAVAVDPPVSAFPSAIGFDLVPPGGSSDPHSTTLTNAGPDAADLGTISVTGSGPTVFEVTADTCSGATLAAAATCSITVVMHAADVAPYAGDLVVPVTVNATPLADLHVPMTGEGSLSAIYPSFTGLHGASPSGTWNGGNALARSQSGATAYLHAIANSRKVGTKTVKDGGPFSPVTYSRSSNGGATWSGGTRLNSKTQHGLWPGLASASPNVYATWVRVAKVRSWSKSAPRSIWFRRNSNHGSGAWATAKRLTAADGRVDYPSIAAAGADVYIAYTNANTGGVKLLVSHNHGKTWSTKSVGSTALNSGSGGKTGLASVAASGNLVVVAWLSDRNGAVKARVSTTAGSTWGSTATLASANRSYPSAAARSGRAGVAFIGAEPSFRTWNGSWGPTVQVPGVDHIWLVDLFGPALVLTGSTGAGLAYSGCVQVCDVYRDGTHLETQYAETPDGGTSWYAGHPLQIGGGSDGLPAYDGVSVIASTSTRRDFTVTGWRPGTTSTRVYHRALDFPIGTSLVAIGQPSSAAGVVPAAGWTFHERATGVR